MLRLYIYKINETELDTRRERAFSVLPLWRVEKVNRMIPAQGKRLSLAAGLLLRHALLDTVGIELKDVKVGFGEREKPYFIFDRHLEFNLSHSGDVVAVALADCPVGIDVEVKQDPGKGVAEHVFTKEELDAMHAAPDPERYFTRLWTRKEAYVKCTGTGISVPLTAFSVLSDTITDPPAGENMKSEKGPEGEREPEAIAKEDFTAKAGSEELHYQIRTLQETETYALSVCVQNSIFPQFSLDIVEHFDI